MVHKPSMVLITVLVGLLSIASLLGAAAAYSLLLALQLVRSALWALLGAALLFEWREKRRWYLMTLGIGAVSCFVAYLAAGVQAFGTANGLVNESNLRNLESSTTIGLLLGVIGYGCLFVGAMGCVTSHLIREPEP